MKSFNSALINVIIISLLAFSCAIQKSNGWDNMPVSIEPVLGFTLSKKRKKKSHAPFIRICYTSENHYTPYKHRYIQITYLNRNPKTKKVVSSKPSITFDLGYEFSIAENDTVSIWSGEDYFYDHYNRHRTNGVLIEFLELDKRYEGLIRADTFWLNKNSYNSYYDLLIEHKIEE